MNPCFFRRFEKKAIFGTLEVEYAPDRKNAAENQVGDNGFCSKSGVQNIEKLYFFAAFENFHFQLHHISEWAKSDRISKIWVNLKSELGFRFFRFLEDEKKSERYAHGFGRHMQNVGKFSNFFPCHNRLPKAPKTHFLSFLGRSTTTKK